MAVLIKQGNSVQTYINEYQCDTLQQFREELWSRSDIKAGSSCIVLEDSSVWSLGEDGNWHEI